MKCIILAGGSGDTLWPLSRKNYPKQFMHIKEGRSMLQETVVRNMPFCDEFIVVTNESYKNIVMGQMKAFQSLNYRIVLETEAKGTAVAVMLGTLFCEEDELVFVVNADNLIEGVNYKDAILRAKELAKTGEIAFIGVKPDGEPGRYDCIYRQSEEVMQFITRRKVMQENIASYENGYLWNGGMFIYIAKNFLELVRIYAGDLYYICRQAKDRAVVMGNATLFSSSLMNNLPEGSVESVVFRRVSGTKVVEADIEWMDVGNVQDLDDLAHSEYACAIENDCDNIVVVNEASSKLVVTNGLKDVAVVNTEDALYISSIDRVSDIKDIIKNNRDEYSMYFDNNMLNYTEWGTSESLNYSDGYRVKKVTVFPGKTIKQHIHETSSEQWSIVEGMATITIGGVTREYTKHETVFVPAGVPHKIENNTGKDVVIIEVGIGV